jgi:hypothetical protein
VTRPGVPSVGDAAWVRNPIDAFVLEQQRMHGVTHSAEAPKGVLLRRVYLDLVGLNPTPDEIAAFEADASSDAYEKVVDRLLADPRYGERWGRHWMDVWRYSDWAGWSGGNQIRDSQPHIWRWRDWIVESLNADKGYDRMVVEMLAADEAYPADESALRATGFLARNYKMLSREQWMEDVVNHTARGLLGVTLHCAKCHDHKFDPLTQEEYYRMRAIFEPHNVRIDPVAGVTDRKVDGLARVFDKEVGAQTLLYIRGDERTPDKARGAMAPGVPACLGGEYKVEPVKLPARAVRPDRQGFVRKDVIDASERSLAEAEKAYAAAKGDATASPQQRADAEVAIGLARAKHRALLTVARAEELEEEGRKDSAEWKAAATAAVTAQRHAAVAQAASDLLAGQKALDVARGQLEKAAGKKPVEAKATKDLKTAQDKVGKAQAALARGTLELSDEPGVAYTPRATESFPETSSGRRLALARWVTDAKNPLTARVAVNHIWARHFAQGLVPSVDDFGANGRAATHPALIDWLASELMSSGWRMKAIHRMIVTSATYRQSSVAGAESKDLPVDPDDQWLWRFPSKRVEAELVRDNVLWASGQLDLARGGPEIDNKQGLVSRRRSLYLREAAEKEVEFLKIFDGPNPNECYFRRPSVLPHQALAMGNSQLVVEQAKVLAGRLKDVAEPGAFVEAAYLRVLARRPAKDEIQACVGFLKDSSVEKGRARENLIVVLFNHNDFVTVR